jgi:hypothetical protein
MRTLKSTPMVADASSSGSHCSSEKRRRRLLFPTEEFPMRRSLTLIVSDMRIVEGSRQEGICKLWGMLRC